MTRNIPLEGPSYRRRKSSAPNQNLFAPGIVQRCSSSDNDVIIRLMVACGRYLIADYERSNFSINQCRFDENVSPDIRTISAPNATNSTNNTFSQPKQAARSLSSGRIAGVVVGSILFVLVSMALALRWRRRRRHQQTNEPQHKQSNPDNSEHTPEVQTQQSSDYELHGEDALPPELHGFANGPLEMEAGVAAFEMSVAGSGKGMER